MESQSSRVGVCLTEGGSCDHECPMFKILQRYDDLSPSIMPRWILNQFPGRSAGLTKIHRRVDAINDSRDGRRKE